MTKCLNFFLLWGVVFWAMIDYKSQGVHDARFSYFLLLFVCNYIGARYYEHMYRAEFDKIRSVLKMVDCPRMFAGEDIYLWVYWLRYWGIGLLTFCVLIVDTVTLLSCKEKRS